ncbi:MAG: hypothetical protein PHX43_08840 [Alphaproteobacteria bacterium]|nr:hypothetical protein [Alphaproteobacteria bacterium]
MVSNISNPASASAAISTLLRAQTTGIIGLKANQQATQAIINQLQKNPSTALQPQTQSIASSEGPLPRGSLVDITV